LAGLLTERNHSSAGSVRNAVDYSNAEAFAQREDPNQETEI